MCIIIFYFFIFFLIFFLGVFERHVLAWGGGLRYTVHIHGTMGKDNIDAERLYIEVQNRPSLDDKQHSS